MYKAFKEKLNKLSAKPNLPLTSQQSEKFDKVCLTVNSTQNQIQTIASTQQNENRIVTVDSMQNQIQTIVSTQQNENRIVTVDFTQNQNHVLANQQSEKLDKL
jgi:hypothetical protein